MELDTYILIGEAIIYIISCTINFVIFYKMHKSTSTKLDEIIRKTEPIIQSQPVLQTVVNPPEEESVINTARVDRDRCAKMNCYYDQSRGVYEISPMNN